LDWSLDRKRLHAAGYWKRGESDHKDEEASDQVSAPSRPNEVRDADGDQSHESRSDADPVGNFSGAHGIFHLAEMSLIAARTAVLESSSDGGAARTALALKKRPELFLAAIRAGDLITDLLIGAFVVTWLTDFSDGALHRVPFVDGYARAVAAVAAFVVVLCRLGAKEHRPRRAGAYGGAHRSSAESADLRGAPIPRYPGKLEQPDPPPASCPPCRAGQDHAGRN
jgi:hypothetical protein